MKNKKTKTLYLFVKLGRCLCLMVQKWVHPVIRSETSETSVTSPRQAQLLTDDKKDDISNVREEVKTL